MASSLLVNCVWKKNPYDQIAEARGNATGIVETVMTFKKVGAGYIDKSAKYDYFTTGSHGIGITTCINLCAAMSVLINSLLICVFASVDRPLSTVLV